MDKHSPNITLVSVSSLPSGFLPYKTTSLGDYCEFNWEIDEIAPENVELDTQAKFQLGNIVPREPSPTTSSTDQSKVIPSLIKDCYWLLLFSKLQRITFFVQDAMRLHVSATTSKQPQKIEPLEINKLRSAHMTWVLANDFDLPDYPDLQFNEYVHLFIKHYDSPQIRNKFAELQKPSKSMNKLNDSAFELFSLLATSICKEGNSPAFKKICRDRQSNIQRNIKSYCGYVDSIMEKNPRLLILRLDLAYVNTAVQGITIEQVRNDMNRFLNNSRHNKTFADQIGYIWKLQNSDQRGIHYHLIIYFTYKDYYQHQVLAKQIGEYWANITDKRGCYLDCSKSLYPYKRLGVGVVGLPNDTVKRMDIHNVLTYLGKRDQSLTIKGVRVWRHAVLK